METISISYSCRVGLPFYCPIKEEEEEEEEEEGATAHIVCTGTKCRSWALVARLGPSAMSLCLYVSMSLSPHRTLPSRTLPPRPPFSHTCAPIIHLLHLEDNKRIFVNNKNRLQACTQCVIGTDRGRGRWTAGGGVGDDGGAGAGALWSPRTENPWQLTHAHTHTHTRIHAHTHTRTHHLKTLVVREHLWTCFRECCAVLGSPDRGPVDRGEGYRMLMYYIMLDVDPFVYFCY